MIGSFEHWLCWQVSSASQLPNEQQFFIVGKFDFLSGELGTPPIASEQSHHSPLLLAGITVRFHTDRYYRSGFTKEILVQVLQQIARRRKPPGPEPQQTFRWGPSVQGGVPKLVVSWHSTPFMGCLGRWTPSRNSCKILSSLERSSPWADHPGPVRPRYLPAASQHDVSRENTPEASHLSREFFSHTTSCAGVCCAADQ